MNIKELNMYSALYNRAIEFIPHPGGTHRLIIRQRGTRTSDNGKR